MPEQHAYCKSRQLRDVVRWHEADEEKRCEKLTSSFRFRRIQADERGKLLTAPYSADT